MQGDGAPPGVSVAALRPLRAALGRADDLRLSLYDQLPSLLRACPSALSIHTLWAGLDDMARLV